LEPCSRRDGDSSPFLSLSLLLLVIR
jgi:hypothetical protein